MEKKCFKCNQVKPLEDFYFHARMKDHHLNKCKLCTKNDVRERYEKYPEKIKEYEKIRSKRPERRKKSREYSVRVYSERREEILGYKKKHRSENMERYLDRQRERRRKNPLKTKAYNKTGREKFKLEHPKKPCEVCGSIVSQMHHPNYAEPLKIEWLCRKHHLEKHGKKCWV